MEILSSGALGGALDRPILAHNNANEGPEEAKHPQNRITNRKTVPTTGQRRKLGDVWSALEAFWDAFGGPKWSRPVPTWQLVDETGRRERPILTWRVNAPLAVRRKAGPRPNGFFGFQRLSKTLKDFQRLSKAFKDLQRLSRTP